MVGHNKAERINDPWKITVCGTCGALVYWYQNKEGKSYPVSVFACNNGFEIRRHGNYNNYVNKHDCTEHTRGQLFANIRKVPEEVQEKVTDVLQQQAITRVLEDFQKSRSAFKKSVLAQAVKFMNGETDYKNPFSPKQALAVIEYGDQYSNSSVSFVQKTKFEASPKFKHILTFKDCEGYVMVDDRDRSSEIIATINGKAHKFHKTYWETRKDLVEWLYGEGAEYTETQEGDVKSYCLLN